MRATVIRGAGDVHVEEVPDAALREPTDAVVRVVLTCVCGSDLWPYKGMERDEDGKRIGHEFLGVVEEVGSEVRSVRPGDLVVSPFTFSDGTCEFCRESLQTSCPSGGVYGAPGEDGAQGEAVRVPHADGTLVPLPVQQDDPLLPSLLTLADVFPTGHHAAVSAGVRRGGSVAVVGDGAVGLCGVLAAARLGADQLIIMGRHQDRTELAREFGATDVVPERGDEAVQRVRDLTGGEGVRSVLECVGTAESMATATRLVRDGGAIGYVGVPQEGGGLDLRELFMRNVRIGGGVCPARAYVEELLPDVLSGAVRPGRVFDHVTDLDGVPDAYRAMADRKALKALVRV
ncbi:zinc-dependent alcohol dehydrogenase family protein [Saccharopolyspora sp. NPDC047091]|uniref:zinc-dependent alcohol dehydrogenase family protein n=1 Tax=Saccharopolyspora sp. NPDC047091 TaxID=3155924 RepID=UPI0033EA7FFF